MKIAICGISKNEDLYLKDWVEYYLKIGVSNIIFNDNNDIDNDNQKNILLSYIDSGFVIYQDYRGKLAYQNKSYEETYVKYNSKFDWIGFFDIDEFLCLDDKYKTINDVFDLNKDLYSKANLIYVNWKCYGDSGKLIYEDIPVYKRFTVAADKNILDGTYKCKKLRVYLNSHIKSFVKCINNAKIVFPVPHNAKFITELSNAINPRGYQCNYCSPWQSICWDVMWLNHYRTLTITEYMDRRSKRQRATCKRTWSKAELFDGFFNINALTLEKLKIFEKYY